MDERTIYDNLLNFFVSLIAKFYKASTTRKLPNILTVFNTYSLFNRGQSSPTPSLSNVISDEKLRTCLSRGVEFLKMFIANMQTEDEGIPVTGGSVEGWRLDNIVVDIISHNIKLHRVSDFMLEAFDSQVSDGVLSMKAKWPHPYLSQNYILNGLIDGKKVAGTGEFKILVSNFVVNFSIKLDEKPERIGVADLKLRADFDDARIQVTGLEIEGSGNAEEIMNSAIQRDKLKFKEMLLTNTLVLSEQAMMVLNAKLNQMPKKAFIDMVVHWCNM